MSAFSTAQKCVAVLSIWSFFATSLPLVERAHAGDAPSTVASKMDNFLTSFQYLGFRPSTADLVADLSDEVVQFFKDNPNAAKTQKGWHLTRTLRKAQNFVTIKRTFDQCQDTKSKHLLQYLTAAGQVDYKVINVTTCRDLYSNFQTIEEFVRDTQSSMTGMLKSDFQDKLSNKALENAARTYMDLEYRYSKGQKVDPDVVSVLCANQRDKENNCTPEMQDVMYGAAAKEHLAMLRAEREGRFVRMTADDARMDINRRIRRINDSIDDIQIGVDEGYVLVPGWNSDDPDFDQQSVDTFQTYQQTYGAEVSSGTGLLLRTDLLKSSAGDIRNMEADVKENYNSRRRRTEYTYPKHKYINDPEDVRKSINQGKWQLINQAQKLIGMQKAKLDRESVLGTGNNRSKINKRRKYNAAVNQDLKRLMRTNPAAVGQVLLENPEYASVACGVVANMKKDDEDDEFWDSAFLWGGLAVAGVLLVASAGAFAAGSAAIAGAVVAGSVAAGVVEATYQFSRARQLSQRARDFEDSFFAGSGNTDNLIAARQALVDYDEAVTTGIMAIGFAALEVGAMTAVIKAGKFGLQVTGRSLSLAQKTRNLKKATEILKRIFSSPALRSVFTRSKAVIGVAKDRTARFMGYLAQLPTAVANKLIARMEAWAEAKQFGKIKFAIEEMLYNAAACQT